MHNLRRYQCTVADKRGHRGDCMESSTQGRYVEYESHVNVVKTLERRIRQLLLSHEMVERGEGI